VVTHSSTVDAVVDASKLLNHEINHLLHALLVRDVHFEGRSVVFFVGCVLFALLGRGFCRLLIHVCEYDHLCPGFGQGEGGLLADAPSGLNSSLAMYMRVNKLVLPTPTTSATPSSCVPEIIVDVDGVQVPGVFALIEAEGRRKCLRNVELNENRGFFLGFR
jgi:hypothetical protein